MNKIYYKSYNVVCLLILSFFISLIFYQYLFTGIIYCDDNTNGFAVFEPLTWDYPSEESLPKNNTQTNTNVLTVYTPLPNQYINIYSFKAYTKYKEIGMRKLYWYSCIKSKGAFDTYGDFKKSWDPNTKVLFEIKKELGKEMKEELHKVNVIKNTFTWIFLPSTRGSRKGKD